MDTINPPGLNIFKATHPGMQGKTNEDRYGYLSYSQPAQGNGLITITVLCDGIGGHSAGEVAAELAVNTILQTVSNNNLDNPKLALEKGILKASQAIFQEAQKDHMRNGMGTTCACALIKGKQLFISYVGDSRIYLWRNKKLALLSKDHTWVQEAIDLGVLSPTDIAGHPNRHVLRRYLGSPKPPMVDTQVHYQNEDSNESSHPDSLSLEKNDIIMLCSDGLTDLVTDDEITQIISRNTPNSAIQQLIALANQRGGHDNISILLIKVSHKKQPTTVTNQKHKLLSCLVIVLFTVLIALAVFFALNYSKLWRKVTPTASLTAALPFPTKTPLPQLESIDQQSLDQPTDVVQTRQSELPTQATITPWPTDTQMP